MTKKILGEFEGVRKDLIQVISAFNQEEINTVPFTGSWTAGQVAEHIYKSDSSFIKGLYGNVKQTKREPDEKVEIIKKIFLDFDSKLNSPDFILPATTVHDKNTVLSLLGSTRDKITEAIKIFDLSETCLSFVPPGLGELTRLEAVYFIIYHTQRHIHQLKNIFQKTRLGTRNS